MKSSTVARLAAALAALAVPLAAQALEYDIRRIDLSSGEIPLASITAINNQGQLAGLTASGQVGILSGDTLNSVALPLRSAVVDDLNDQGMLVAHDFSGSNAGSFNNIYTYSAQGGLKEIQASKDEYYVVQSYPKSSSAGHIVMYGAENGSWGGHGISAILTRPDGSYIKLAGYDYDGQAVDVNSSGIAVGSGLSSAVYWDATGQKHVLGKMGGDYAGLSYVTDSGWAAGGYSVTDSNGYGHSSAFIYSLASGQTRSIDGLVFLKGLDEAGRLYGARDGTWESVVWDDGQYTDLSALLNAAGGSGSYSIIGVSSDGRVLMYEAGTSIRYVLTPTPEPGTYVLMGIGLGAAAWGARRRRARAA